jgi:hypothetical protein
VDFQIQGLMFKCPAPFSEGHKCSAGDAGTLNQTLRENVRNRFAKPFEKIMADATEAGKQVNTAELQKQLDEYILSYEFGGKTRAPVDPVERRALELARARVEDALKKAGKKLADYSNEDLKAAAQEAVEKNPKFRQVAQKQVDELNSLAI